MSHDLMALQKASHKAHEREKKER